VAPACRITSNMRRASDVGSPLLAASRLSSRLLMLTVA
jgi:hypothetical protein